MFLNDIKTLVCTILSDQKWLTVQKLYNIVKRTVTISLPNFYKIIAKLIDEQVIVKKNMKLQLHDMRIQHTLMLADKIKLHYIQDEEVHIEKLKPWQSQVFEAPSLYDVDILWTDALSKLYAKYTWDIAYYYNSHPYHILGMTQKEKWNLTALGKKMAKTYFLFWNTSFLDIYGSELLQMQWYEIRCINTTSFPEEWYCINIIWDYLIEILFPDSITQYFKIFFESVHNTKWFNTEMFTSIMKMKATCTLKIIHSPEHAKKMTSKIKQYFK